MWLDIHNTLKLLYDLQADITLGYELIYVQPFSRNSLKNVLSIYNNIYKSIF